ncbi:MAG: glycosyl transferase, family 2 [Candidatus Eremiobacteraeota bacterium]|nr:glycosyl transferase, family 2 [Candidatus Eremiobacteraeota bacterium]
MTVETFWDNAAHAAAAERLRALAHVLGGDLVVATDPAGLSASVARLIDARRHGTLTALYVALPDPLEQLVVSVYGQAWANDDLEHRKAIADGFARSTLTINGKPVAEHAVVDPAFRRALYAAVRLADVVLVDSAEHARRLEAVLGRPPNRAVPIVAGPRADLPLPRGRRVVVYAPRIERTALRVFDVLFANRDFPWSVIARENARDPLPGDTAVAIAPAWTSLDDSLALHARGIRVAAPFGSGAPAVGVAFGYDPLRAKTLFRAIDAALTEQMPVCGVTARVDDAVGRERVERNGGPLLSAIVRTYDRPGLLRRALESLAEQTYRDLEVVVVNDAGPDVTPLLAELAERLTIRYVHRASNGGLVAAVNDGVRNARGTYIGYLDDDDMWYPDHAARLVDALERTGAGVAYGNCVAEYADVVDGILVPREYAIFTDRDFEKDAYLYDNLATVHSYVHRRDLFERFGLFDEAMGAADDWEMWLRMTRDIDFVHVDRVTVEYSWRRDPSSENMTFRKQRAFANAHLHVAQKHAAAYARWPSLLRGRHDTAARFNAVAEQLEVDPSLAHAFFVPPDPVP